MAPPKSSEELILQRPINVDRNRQRKRWARVIRRCFSWFLVACAIFVIIGQLMVIIHLEWSFDARLQKLEKMRVTDNECQTGNERSRRHKDSEDESNHAPKTSAQTAKQGTEVAVLYLKSKCKATVDATISCWRVENRTGDIVATNRHVQIKKSGYYQIQASLKPALRNITWRYEASIMANDKAIIESSWTCNKSCSYSMQRLYYLRKDDIVRIDGMGRGMEWEGIRTKLFQNNKEFITTVFSVHLVP